MIRGRMLKTQAKKSEEKPLFEHGMSLTDVLMLLSDGISSRIQGETARHCKIHSKNYSWHSHQLRLLMHHMNLRY
jgi:hypothetical protein